MGRCEEARVAGGFGWLSAKSFNVQITIRIAAFYLTYD